jgi:hypothetical protein
MLVAFRLTPENCHHRLARYSLFRAPTERHTPKIPANLRFAFVNTAAIPALAGAL